MALHVAHIEGSTTLGTEIKESSYVSNLLQLNTLKDAKAMVTTQWSLS